MLEVLGCYSNLTVSDESLASFKMSRRIFPSKEGARSRLAHIYIYIYTHDIHTTTNPYVFISTCIRLFCSSACTLLSKFKHFRQS